MKRILAACVIFFFAGIKSSHPQTPAVPDTVKVGVYFTSIHDINFKDREFSAIFWVWFRYKNKAFDFYNNLEMPLAKTFTNSYLTVDSSTGEVYMLMKVQCVMKDSWQIINFPFDRQHLRLSIESAQFDAKTLVFVPDALGKQVDPRFALRDWDIDSCNLSISSHPYETAFGDTKMTTPHSDYSSFNVVLVIKRDANGLFWKLFLGMYIAFLIAITCFFIHADAFDSRFALSVGALFAVIGNKYIIDSSLPETTSFTLVDTLHGITLFYIFSCIACNAWSMKLVKDNKEKHALKFDRRIAWIMILSYLALNLWFVIMAKRT